jgi:polyferredoxin
MTYGKQVCKTLKEIRQTIAEKNDIQYETTECHFDGECQGTCPKCDAELRYLENEIHKRKHLGKVATLAGLSLSIATTFSACQTGDIVEPPPPPIETGFAGAPHVECVYENSNSDTNTISIDTVSTGIGMPE